MENVTRACVCVSSPSRERLVNEELNRKSTKSTGSASDFGSESSFVFLIDSGKKPVDN